MLEVSLSGQDVSSVTAELLAVPVFTDLEPGPGTAEALAALGTTLPDLLRARDFSGEAGQTVSVPTLGRLPAATLMLVGVGERNKVDTEAVRRATAAIVRRAGGAKSAATTLAQVAADRADGVRAVAEAALLASYRFERFKTNGKVVTENNREPAHRLDGLEILTGDGAGLERALAVGKVRARATNLARDLSNTPANHMHPCDLADAAVAAVEGRGVATRVWDEKELREGGFGGISGVGQGAEYPPRLVELRYEPEGAKGSVVLVGKGICFDSGGLSLKPADSMATMKTDMSGAASLVGVMSVLRELGVSVRVTGYLAAAENMPSGTAIRPGDVLSHFNGKTCEVLNTDAEGRLVMADALALGADSEPDAIVDVATLTGACMVALGLKYTGLMSNDDALSAELLDAAAEAGEPTWRLPLPEEYRKDLVSEVADLKNVGPRWGSALTAGLFLKEFVGNVPWAHLDIAGPARAESDDAYTPKGSTGTAVRTLLTWLERRGAQG
jgi:leucyl aminopeptidase